MTTLSPSEAPSADGRGAPGAPPLTPEQSAAVERRDGPLFVHAGAGSGKTIVLVERFVRAVLDDGVPVDRLLAITFTEKAAAELRVRVRERLLEADAREAARAVERAWVSTIHGFCARLLRAHALAAGVDPEFRVLDEHTAERLAARAFEGALEDFVGRPPDARRVELLAAYEPGRLEEALRAAHAHLRSRGEPRPRLPLVERPTDGEVARAHARLRSAVHAARGCLAADGARGDARVAGALERLERCANACEALAPRAALDPFELRELAVRRGNVTALRGTELDEFEAARSACLELCARRRAVNDVELISELLGAYGRRFAGLKAERSALDFDDLELLARDLLGRRPALRQRLRDRFVHVLVDELQDTNRLQSELLDLVSDGNVFTVGDELQSIYGFRGADVGVFAERRAAARAAGREARLTATFRAPRELADVLNAAFAPVVGDGFVPLEATRAAGAGEPLVEVLAVDRDNRRWEAAAPAGGEPFGAAMSGVPAWRAAEARLLAARVDELVSAGEFAAGEVALLTSTWTDVDRYERALAERGLPTYVAGGGGLWSGREVADVRAYLAVVANPLDEDALVAALASPLVGASLDALALLGPRARGGPGLWRTLVAAVDLAEDGDEAGARDAGERDAGRSDPAARAVELRSVLPPGDLERLAAFVSRLRAERADAPRLPLAALIERVVAGSGYDRHVLALPAGERRFANLRKLKRLAREHEAGEGRDLRAFLDALDRRARAAVREGEAPLEGEGLGAVRIMTIHAAKGLEFPLVCVADLGRGERPGSRTLRVSDDGRVGLRLPCPAGGGALDALDATALADEAARAEQAEKSRLLWVAATRAERRLIVSGALDLERDSGAVPMEWLAPALVPDLRAAARGGAREGVHQHAWRGRTASVAWRVATPATADGDVPAGVRDPATARTSAGEKVGEPAASGEQSADQGPTVVRDLPSASVTVHRGATAPEPPTRISYSALESHRRCGYRFHLERELGLPAAGHAPAGASASLTGAHRSPGGDGVDASGRAIARGAVVHELLERLDLRRGAPPAEAAIGARLETHGVAATGDTVDEVRRLVAGFLSSPLCRRMAGARRVRREVPFAFPLELAPSTHSGGRGSMLVEGVIDAYCEEDGDALVVDYKSDRVSPGADLEATCRRDYPTQRLVYALAALRAGASRVAVAHVFLELPAEPAIAAYRAEDAPALESRLAGLVAELLSGRREPSPTPGIELCAGCPGRAALCSWSLERTNSPRAEAA
jgi:ATP-dependent helicase/nuclease subunit A